MKKIFIWLVFVSWSASSQTLYLNLSGASAGETKIIDSIGYNSKHTNAKSVLAEADRFTEQLSKTGYLEHEILSSTKPNDSLFDFVLKLGKKTKSIHIWVGSQQVKSTLLFDKTKDTIVIPYIESENFLNQTLGKLEKKGFAMAKLQLRNIRQKNGNLAADLLLTLENQRHLDDIVIKGYDHFPEGHKYNIKRIYKNKIFNQDNLKKLYADFEKYRFVKQTKYPEILFEKDSTKVYVYLEKAKANTFDGFVGFSNDKQKKINFTGYLDLTLNNILNTGEAFTLYWKSDGNKQKTFNAAIELPYVFRSPLGIKAQLNIFKQDSTFQNTQTAISVGYFFNYNKRLYLGYQSTESSDIQNINSASITDFKNAFVTTNFEFLNYNSDDFLFPQKTKVNIKVGIGSRISKNNNNKQALLSLQLQHNIYLNQKNIFNIRSENYYLKSDAYILNELYRFGGINSIRGFNENSLQCNALSSIMTEYRYIFAQGIYVHSIVDYAYYQDQATNNTGTLLGLGLGLGLLTKNGLFNIVYANGSTKQQTVKLSNSIVHVSFKANF